MWITNLAKCSQDDARPLSDDVFLEYKNLLKEGCLFMSVKLNTMKSETFNKRISKAMFEFSSDEKSLNSRNCDQNHIILDMITSKVLAYDYKNLTDEQKQEVKELSKDILNNWIYKGLFNL